MKPRLGAVRAVLFAVVFLPSAAMAVQSSEFLEVTGRLVDRTGKSRTGSEVLRFEVWDSGVGGNRIWAETRRVHVTAGEYKVLLGKLAPIPSLAELTSYRVVVEAPQGTDSVVTLRNLTVKPPEDTAATEDTRTTLKQELERSRREVAALRERLASLGKPRPAHAAEAPSEDGTPLALRDSLSDGGPWSQEGNATPAETAKKAASIKKALEKESLILKQRLDHAMKEAEKKSSRK